MQSFEIIALVVSAVGVVCFAVIFTILYRSYAATSVAEIEGGQRDVELIERVILENLKNTKKRHRIIRRVKQVLSIAVIAILVPFLILAIISKAQNGVVMIFDKGIIGVASGSMSEKHKDNTYLSNYDNQFDTYDLIGHKVLRFNRGAIKIDHITRLGLGDSKCYLFYLAADVQR